MPEWKSLPPSAGSALHWESQCAHNILAVELLTNRSGVTNRNRGLDDHDSVRVILHDQLDHRLNSRCVEVLGVAIVVGRGRNNNKVRIRVCSTSHAILVFLMSALMLRFVGK